MSIQATKPDMNATSRQITSNELIKSEYVLKVNNIPTNSTPTSKASRINPNNLPSTRVKNVKRRRALIVTSLFFLFAFTIAVYFGYTATFKLYEPGTTLLNFGL
jgi:hypothetical protein